MREISETLTTPASSLQYNIESFDNGESTDHFDDCRASAWQMGLQAMDRAQDRALTPIYFAAYNAGTGFDSRGAQVTSQNYYQIKNNFAKI